ncbi:MAG: hypothetical protein M3Q77_01720, partial [Thermoproteota archaeon]|nr:hypothetical protein [Thermoproteota archaeon]
MYYYLPKILGVFLISSIMILGINYFLTNNDIPKLVEFLDVSATTNSSNSTSLTNIQQSTINHNTSSNSSNLNTDVIKTLSEEDKPLLC